MISTVFVWHIWFLTFIFVSKRRLCRIIIFTLQPNDAIWWLRYGSTLAQVMACRLTGLTPYGLIIGKVSRQVFEGIIIRKSEYNIPLNKIDNCVFKFASRSFSDRCVNSNTKIPWVQFFLALSGHQLHPSVNDTEANRTGDQTGLELRDVVE